MNMRRLVTIDQNRSAEIVEAMLTMPPWCDEMWARGALMVAARAIRRGRHLTDKERIENVKKRLKPELRKRLKQRRAPAE